MVDCTETLERPYKLQNSGTLSADELYQQCFILLDVGDDRSNSSDATRLSEDILVRYAGFWRRFGAFWIDSIIVIIVGCIGGCLIGLFYVISVTVTNVDDISPSDIGVDAGIFGFIWGIVVDYLYCTAMESSSMQATFGKRLLNTIVTNYEFRRIGLAQANARYWGKLVSSLSFCIGFLMVAFTEKKQALHDQLAGTLVIIKHR